MTEKTGTFSAVGYSDAIKVQARNTLNYKLSVADGDTYDGTVLLETSMNNGATWEVAATETAVTSPLYKQIFAANDALYRLHCTVLDGDNILYEIEDVAYIALPATPRGDIEQVEINNPIDLYSYPEVVGKPGRKTRIRATAAMDRMLWGVTADDVVLRDIVLDGNGVAKAGLTASSMQRLLLERVKFLRTTENAIRGNSAANARWTLVDVECEDCYTGSTFDPEGVDAADPDNWIFQNLYFDSGALDGLTLINFIGDALIVSSNDGDVDNIHIKGHSHLTGPKMPLEILSNGSGVTTNLFMDDGILIDGGGYNAQMSINGVQGGRIGKVIVDAGENDSLKPYGIEAIACGSKLIFDGPSVNNAQRSVMVSGATDDLEFENLLLQNFSSYGFFCQDASYVKLLHSTIKNPVDTLAHMVCFTNNDFATANFNTVLCKKDNSNKAKDGIRFEYGAEHNGAEACHNLITNAQEKAVRLYSAGTPTVHRVKVRGNTGDGNAAGYTVEGVVVDTNNDDVADPGTI